MRPQMNKNIGKTDQIIRFVIAIAFFSLFFVLTMPMKLLGLIGVVPLLTAIFGFCPLYKLLGMDTCRIKSS